VTTAAPSRRPAEQHRRIVEAILGQLPSGAIGRVEIVRLVSDLGLGSAASRSLAGYLVAHPDGLVSGHSGGPRTWLHLLNGLADRLPALVAGPRCVRCRRTVALFRWMGEQRCCTTCYARAHVAVCAGCGEVRPVARRAKGGEAICTRCDRRDPSRWEACTSCGKAARVAARPPTGPLCQNCIPKRLYTCAQCGRPGQQARAFTDGGPICNACYQRGKVERCSQCGVVSPYVRARPDTGTALCDSCWQPPPLTCTVCGVARPIKRGRTSRTPICGSCRAKKRQRRACAECGRLRPVHIRLLMGGVCGTCYTRLRNNPAVCADCGSVRPLIGRNNADHRICGPCAGERITFTCRTCGDFAALYADGNCASCVARRRVTELCSTATGQVHPQLQPVIDALDIDDRPRAVIGWLHDRGWAETLALIARTEGQISHRMLDDLPQTNSVVYTRAVLVSLGVLESRDEEIDGTLPWLKDLLAVQPPAIATIIRPYAIWWVLRRARRRKPRGNGAARRNARTRIVVAVEFLTWIDSRGQLLQTATQADVDEWLAAGSTTRYRLRDFLLWSHAHRLSSSLEVPWLQRGEPSSYLDDARRRDLLNTALHELNRCG